ncbi:hypothetical protein QQS21_006345 [Conoideocrella luteorostrata]|uniref:Molybdenum cofactor sulfurase n=1 Tax=Conoideocrella luteorostrata TaxID=1105319 RepID=A0AAJ0CMT2_9HYPO|nr:hypothetical protein QQS21_006345 [Conoideocrella luteorostrata]
MSALGLYRQAVLGSEDQRLCQRFNEPEHARLALVLDLTGNESHKLSAEISTPHRTSRMPSLTVAESPATGTSADREIYDNRIEQMRRDEYPMLRGKRGRPISYDRSRHLLTRSPGQTYLDHAGMAIPSRSLIDAFSKTMSSNIFGNPHSELVSSPQSTGTIEDTRLRVLQMFNADPADFDLIFVANATAGVKLVAESFRSAPGGFDYIYHQSSHTSLVGLRQEAHNSVCLGNTAINDWLAGGPSPLRMERQQRLTLFSYPAQSNFDGSRFPLDWPWRQRKRTQGDAGDGVQSFSLLDAAAYASTALLDLSNTNQAPDFTVVSFYKIFGFPDLGGLIVRRESAPILLNRRYFGGGTVESVVCEGEPWHARKSQSIHEALEDGTLPIHSIVALGAAMITHRHLFCSMQEISHHTSFLIRKLHNLLADLRHGNGSPVCILYSKKSSIISGEISGPIVAFNMLTEAGQWVSPGEFQKLAILKGFHTRVGGVCNPGGIATALDLSSTDIKNNFSLGIRCGEENDIIRGRPTGVIRVSLGAMSTQSDITNFIHFLREFYTSTKSTSETMSIRNSKQLSALFVEDIVVFPIKSCQGFRVPRGQSWHVRAQGLVWDREWCLVNRATNRLMTLKRYPRMAFIRPFISLHQNMMKIQFGANGSEYPPSYISIPLSSDMTSGCLDLEVERVKVSTGFETLVRKYVSETLNNFFSNAVGTPCALARICHRGQIENTQEPGLGFKEVTMPGAFPDPDRLSSYDTGTKAVENTSGSFSNESPILAINMASLYQLNKDIEAVSGQPVSPDSFRANLILRPSQYASLESAYCEDRWSRVQIGRLKFNVLGPCQRCHMICIDPRTSIRRPEPYVTLSKTRRFGGKIFFGSHLAMINSELEMYGSGEVHAIQTGYEVVACT